MSYQLTANESKERVVLVYGDRIEVKSKVKISIKMKFILGNKDIYLYPNLTVTIHSINLVSTKNHVFKTVK